MRLPFALFALVWAAVMLPKQLQAESPTISPQDIEAFLDRCVYIDVPYRAQENLRRVSIRGMEPTRYFSADSGEGRMWGFEFDMSASEFKRRAPELVQRVDFPIPSAEREFTTALYRILEEPLDTTNMARLVCRTEVIGEEEP